jgi:hypothetical protein
MNENYPREHDFMNIVVVEFHKLKMSGFSIVAIELQVKV